MTLEKFLRFVVLAGIFLLPFLVLYVSKSLFFPFISGKNFAFRIIVEMVAGGWLALAISNPAYRPKRTWLLWAFTLFIAVMAVADIFSIYPHKSFWSNYERMEGWVTLAHLFVMFVVMQSMLTTEKLWRQWWHTSLSVSFIVALIGFAQLAGLETINQGQERIDARLGNATYLGVYMLFHVFIAAFYLARAWIDRPQYRSSYAFLYGVVIVSDALVLFYSATRGAILGLFGGAMLAALILIILAPRSRVAWRAGSAIVGLLIVVGLFWMVSDQKWIENVEPLYRLSIIGQEGIPDARAMNWGMALEGFKERPIFGWGQESYSAVFDKYYDPGMYAQEPWFDRVHNIFFDWLVAGGILGLLAYLSLHAFALTLVWRKDAFAPYERAILTGLLAAYFFYLLFTFDNITSYILFIALLAFIAARATQDGRPLFESRTLVRSALPYTALGALILVSVTVWEVNADAIRQNRTLIRAISPQPTGVQANLEIFKLAVAYDSVGNQEVREQFSQAATGIVGAQDVPVALKQEFVQAALTSMQELADEAPRNARFPLFLGILLNQAGAYADAKTALEKAHELSPEKQSILYELGLNAFARGQNDEAVTYFKNAYELATENLQAKRFLAIALIRAERDAEADVLLRELVDVDGAIDNRLASALASRGQFQKVIDIWTAHKDAHPEDLDARFVLAGAWHAAGNSARAIQELETIKKEYPNATAQADDLIAQIRGGAQ